MPSLPTQISKSPVLLGVFFWGGCSASPLPQEQDGSVQGRMRPSSHCGAGQQDGVNTTRHVSQLPADIPGDPGAGNNSLPGLLPAQRALAAETAPSNNQDTAGAAGSAINITAPPQGQALPRSSLRVWVQRIYSWIVQSWVGTGSWLRDLPREIGLCARAVMGKSQLATGAAGRGCSCTLLAVLAAFPVIFPKGKQENFGFLFLAVVFLWG